MDLSKEEAIRRLAAHARSKLIDAKGVPINGNVIQSENVFPLLSSGYHRHNLEYETKLVPPLSLNKILDAPIAAVMNLHIQPGDKGFLLWFFVSSFLPLFSACVAPLANMISIIGLVESWRFDTETLELVTDPASVKALNVLSLVFGLIGNTSLLVNFTTTKRYVIAQAISICCWSAASMILLAAVLVLNKDFMDGPYGRTEGHWLSTFTIVYYFINTCTMSLNMLGFIINKYPALLNLSKSERNLMGYTVALSFWLVIGAVSCKYLIPDLNFGSALYYCVVSVLTIGLGDILPVSRGAKSFILVFSLIGVILMGLVITMIRQVSHKTKQPVILWHRMEVERKKMLDYIIENDYQLKQEEGFDLMRLIDHKSHAEQETISLAITLLVFCGFWFLGALVFHSTEDWSYFDAMYFCLLCLITIGYGDFAPASPLGRVFFISWAISAVPLMTILITNVGDTLFGSVGAKAVFQQLWRQSAGMFIISTQSINPKRKDHEVEHNLQVVRSSFSDRSRDSRDYDECPDAGIDELLDEHTKIATSSSDKNDESEIDEMFSDKSLASKIRTQKAELVSILDFVNSLKPLLEDTIESPSMEYDHEAWSKLINKLFVDKKVAAEHQQKPYYWLGENSPLRLPLQEPNYFISRIFYRIETDLLKLIQGSDKELETLLKDKQD